MVIWTRLVTRKEINEKKKKKKKKIFTRVTDKSKTILYESHQQVFIASVWVITKLLSLKK